MATGRGVEVIEMPDPVPASGQLLAAPLATGICGSDLHLVESYDELGPGVPPIVMGHEFCARVLERPPGSSGRFPVGTRVVSVPYARAPDGPELLGLSAILPGGFAEAMVLDEERLIAVPEEVEHRVAALTEPLAVGVHAAAAGRLTRGDVVLVLGCGPIGLCVLAALKAAGVGPVVACDFSAARRARAEELGADIVIDPASTSPYKQWAQLGIEEAPASPLLDDLVSPESRVVAFECVGVPGVLQQLVNGVPRHSRIVVVGACTRPDTLIPVTALVKELTVTFVFAYRPAEFAAAFHLLAQSRIAASALISGQVDLDGVPAAFEELRRPEHHVKILVLGSE